MFHDPPHLIIENCLYTQGGFFKGLLGRCDTLPLFKPPNLAIFAVSAGVSGADWPASLLARADFPDLTPEIGISGRAWPEIEDLSGFTRARARVRPPRSAVRPFSCSRAL